jgi:hypothetical protein
MEKLIRDGKVGVLVSPGFGGGFYTWGAPLQSIFDPTLVEMVDERWNMRFFWDNNVDEHDRIKFGWGDRGRLTELQFHDNPKYSELTQKMIDYVESTYEGVFSGGVEDLKVEWIPEGSEFIIEEYDGSESLRLKDDINWLKA